LIHVIDNCLPIVYHFTNTPCMHENCQQVVYRCCHGNNMNEKPLKGQLAIIQFDLQHRRMW